MVGVEDAALADGTLPDSRVQGVDDQLEGQVQSNWKGRFNRCAQHLSSGGVVANWNRKYSWEARKPFFEVIASGSSFAEAVRRVPAAHSACPVWWRQSGAMTLTKGHRGGTSASTPPVQARPQPLVDSGSPSSPGRFSRDRLISLRGRSIGRIVEQAVGVGVALKS